MKITIEVPDTTLVMTYQVVYDDESSLNMAIMQCTLDTNALKKIREACGNQSKWQWRGAQEGE